MVNLGGSDGTEFSVHLCNAPSSQKTLKKNVSTMCVSMIGKLGTRAWNLTMLIRFYTDFYTTCLWAANPDVRTPPQSPPLPLGEDLLPIALKRFVYDFWSNNATMFYDSFTGTS